MISLYQENCRVYTDFRRQTGQTFTSHNIYLQEFFFLLNKTTKVFINVLLCRGMLSFNNNGHCNIIFIGVT